MEHLIKRLYSQKSLEELNHDLLCLGKDTKYNEITFCKDRTHLSFVEFTEQFRNMIKTLEERVC